MTLRHLKIFCTVAKTENISKAAKQLLISQPSVSIAIKELEEYYGIKLFERFNKRIQITDIGIKFEGYANHIINLSHEMELTFKNSESSNMIHIGASITVGSYYLPKYISSFKLTNPADTVKVSIASSETIEEMILTNKLDFGVIEGIVHSDNIMSQKIRNDFLIAICAPDHPFAKSKHILLDEFLSQPLLLREIGSGTRELFDNAVALQNRTVTPLWESTSTDAIINGVKSGFGLSVLPEHLVEKEISNGILSKIAIENIELNREIRCIYHKNKYINKTITQFFNTIFPLSSESLE